MGPEQPARDEMGGPGRRAHPPSRRAGACRAVPAAPPALRLLRCTTCAARPVPLL